MLQTLTYSNDGEGMHLKQVNGVINQGGFR